ncbi:TonB-dependent receptor domain-containing protein [Polaromonas sp. CG_9.11]|uniref:TonB-dependent receptor domain-containing protein n=1 Tax=Polaromonas sp. CG_9.11 TaxID=2787730 RepID=UPI0018CB9F8B|nr:TonB-dependent receptor [Polaromonas sp. CG_9.11]MBG6074978.1 vitamin B12 transporter [Polaromonas sp. CG_9.11]
MKICISNVRLAALPLALAAVFPSFSQMRPAPQLREMVVTATRAAQPLSDLVADVSIVDRAMIERSGATGVADLLARLPGIEINRNGGVGGTTSVFSRGGNSHHTAVYLDGVRLDTQSGSGGAAWESIPLAQIDRIEVLRGPAAAVYGSDAINGVIQLFTRKGQGPATPYVGVAAGSHGLRKLDAGISGSVGVDGAFDYSLGLAHEASDGYDAQPQRLRIPGDFSTTPPGDGLRNPDKDGYRSTSANARLGYQVNRAHRLDATLLASDLKAHYDDFSHDPAVPVDDLAHTKLRAVGLNWSAQWSDSYSTRLSLTDSYNGYETTPSSYLTTTTLRGYLFQNELRFGPHLVTAALERREDELENSDVGATRTRTQNAVALGYGLVQGSHTVQLNVRHDDDSGFGGKSTGSAAYGLAITPKLRLTASAGTAFRAPTLYQRFSEYGVSSLQPETSRNLEAGLRFSEGANSLGLVAYRNKVRNLITFVDQPGACLSPFGCYDSVARAEYKGITVSGSYALSGVKLGASADFQNPTDKDTGKQLARRSKRHGTLTADTRVGSWLLGAEAQFSGRRFDNAANTRTLSGYTLLNLSASTPLSKDWTLLARVDNLADKQYELARTYATAGRSFYAGVKWSPK